MSKVTVVARVVARKNSVEAVKAELVRLVAPTRREDGCIEYRLHQDNEDHAVFVFYENWESRESLDRHMNSVHFKEYVAAVEGLVADKTVHLLTEIQRD